MSNGHPSSGSQAAGPSNAGPSGSSGSPAPSGAASPAAEVPRLELYAHVSTESGRVAKQHVERLHSQRLAGTAELAIFDLDRSPVAAQNARILLTPALILRGPRGEHRCFGDFSDLDRVCAALAPASPPAEAAP